MPEPSPLHYGKVPAMSPRAPTPRAPLAVLGSVAAMGVVLKLGRLWGIAEGAGDPGLLRLFPGSIGRDLATAAVCALAVWLLARKAPRAAAVVGRCV